MKAYGQCMPGGPINATSVPVPTDPTLRDRRAPAPRPLPRQTFRLNQPRSRPRGKISDVDLATIREAVADGARVAELAVEFGVTRQTLYRKLREAS